MFVMSLVFFFFPETYRINAKFDVELPTTAEPKNADNASLSGTLDENAPASKYHDMVEKEDSAEEKSPVVEQKKRRMNPIASFYFLRHPFVLLSSLISGIAFGCMFAVETIIPSLYEEHYGFTSWKTGLSFLGAGIGNLIGAVVNGFLSDRLLLRARERRGGRAVCEDRLTVNLWPACFIIIPFGVLLFGWSIEKGMTVWAPIVGFGIQTFGMNQVMTSTSAYLVDSVPGQGASITASANFVRMLLACAFTLAANPMVAAIGPGWTSVFLAGLSYIACVCLVILKWKGEALRKWSGFDKSA
jgi:MFS family permease